MQNLVKTWEMEMFHKTRDEDFKASDPKKYTFSLNGKYCITKYIKTHHYTVQSPVSINCACNLQEGKL